MIDDEKTIVAYEADEPAEDKKNDTMRKVAIGGGIGILLGASAAAVASTLSNADATPDEDVEVEPAPDTVSVAGNVSDGMSFGDAFAAARAELGPGGMFTWHGNSYSTYTADEWDNMSAGERAEYGRMVAPHVQFDNGHYGGGGSHSSHTVHHVHHQVVDDGGQPQEDVTTGGGDVHIDKVEVNTITEEKTEPVEVQPEQAMTGKGDELNLDLAHVRVTEAEEVETFDDVDTVVGKGFVDGHDAMFHDLDNNGIFDAATVDTNDNHTFIDDQKYDISDLHLSTQNVEAEI
jgi:hypothetical protein